MPYDKKTILKNAEIPEIWRTLLKKKKITAADFSWIGFRFRKWQELC